MRTADHLITSPSERGRAGGGWFKSSFSNGSGTCVEVRFHDDLVSVRDSKDRRPDQPTITITANEWRRFLDSLDTDTPGDGPLTAAITPTGTLLRAPDQGVTLRFTPAEWRAYLLGVRHHEFDPPLVGR